MTEFETLSSAAGRDEDEDEDEQGRVDEEEEERGGMRDGEVLERTMEGGLTFTKPRLSTQPPRLSGLQFSFSGKPHFGVQVSSFPLPFGPASAITCTCTSI